MMCTSSNEETENTRKVKVVILGAGASGLQCAASLLNLDSDNFGNTSLLVLEARNRVGGRVLTTKETCSRTKEGLGQEVLFYRDHGAAWVHGTGHKSDEQNPMVTLLEKCTPDGQSAVETHLKPIFDGNPWTRPGTMLHQTARIAIFMDGKRIPNESPIVAESIRRHYDLQNKVAAHTDHMFDSGAGMETVHLSVDQLRLEFLEKEEKEADTNVDSEMVEKLFPFYNFLVENWNGQSSSDMQVGSVVEGAEEGPYISDGDYEGPHCKVKNGMITILQPLASQVEEHIRLNERVVKISKQMDHVRVETASGLVVQAECCVSTIPLGCLQKTMDTLFDPSLGCDKVEAIRSISSGAYKKVFLTFDDIFWPADEPLIGLIRNNVSSNNQVGRYLLINNIWAKSGIPVMEAVLCGRPGKWAMHRKDEEIRDVVVSFLEAAMGLSNLQESCTACHITRWEEDPFTMGTYSSFHLGTLERHAETFSIPEWGGRLVFSGEHTESEHMGSVHAALISGTRASKSVSQFLDSSDCTELIENGVSSL